MNEGKPTKPKWWSRPRLQGAAPDTTTDHLPVGAAADPGTPKAGPADAGPSLEGHEGDPGGDDELHRPARSGAPRGDIGSDTDARLVRDGEGDFELGRPGGSGSGIGAYVERDDPDSDGDFELERPASVQREAEADGSSSGAVHPVTGSTPVAEAASGGALEDRVSVLGVVQPVAGHVPVAEAASGGALGDRVPAPGVVQPVTGSMPVAEAASGAAMEDRVPAPSADQTERAKPLHDPDPYGTPPYGQPGPWAPAPPVQHPATTSTREAHAAAGTPAYEAHAPAGTPAQGTRVPAGTAVHEAHAATGAPAHGTQLPPGVPAHAPSAPLTSADPGTASAHAPASAPLTSADPGTASAPARAPVPPAQDDQIPPAPPGGSPAPAPAPYAGSAHNAPVPNPRAATPWQNYDPWAAPGPLQQNGAAVVSVVQRRKRAKKTLVLGAVVLALVSGGLGGAVGAYLERNGGMGDVELPQAAKEAPGRAPASVAGIAAHALPSVVTLHVRGSGEEGTGTGFVLDRQGHILTNNHVIEPAGSGGEISVTFSGGQSADAEVVGHDSGYDLAVVKVSGVSGLDPMPLGNSDNVQVGDPVVAIGAPFDLANTVTSGIISAKERPITAGGDKGDGSDVSYVDALQTDAPINPGNSGGPLLDSKARVIGINSAIRSADSGSDLESGQAGSIGLGFAIPINQGKRVAEELINTGKATHPVIGVTLDMNYTGDGARVGTKSNGGGPPVTAGGPGAEAGVKAGDIITEVDGRRVHSGEELIVKTRAHRPGDRLRLTLTRGGTEKKVILVLGSADGD
jgi:putative serine protease PepD